MKVAAYVADFLAALTEQPACQPAIEELVPKTRVYGVCGAGAMHLNDAIAHHPGIRFQPMHHEQAASFAAEADARVSGRPGIVHVTSGPGVTNVVTGVACAWADSIPLLVLAGQVETRTMMNGSGERQRGVSEVDGCALMGSITKYAVTITRPDETPYHLGHALHLATSGRPGPVYIEIPLDVQNAEMTNPEPYVPPARVRRGFEFDLPRFLKLLRGTARPVLIVGHGVRLAGACAEMLRLIDDLQMPVLTTWNASDIVPSAHPCCVGRFGLFGDRAGNFAVQNADLVIAIGARLSIPQVGHTPVLFAPHARRVVVDIDGAEATKDYLRADLAIVADARDFLAALFGAGVHHHGGRWGDWKARCTGWKLRYPVMRPEYRDAEDGVNAYVFMRELARHLADDAIVVTDVGTAFVCAQQALSLNGRQRLFHASGIAPMGYGLPAAIGACLAGGGRQVVCLTGDGGAMFNLQEFATIAHHKLPTAIFVLQNGGYRTMQVTQGNHFGRETAASTESGVGMPNFSLLADAFGISYRIDGSSGLSNWIVEALKMGSVGPVMGVLNLAPNQQIQPRVQSRMQDGAFVPVPIEDMYPYLDREELVRNMGDRSPALAVVGGKA